MPNFQQVREGARNSLLSLSPLSEESVELSEQEADCNQKHSAEAFIVNQRRQEFHQLLLQTGYCNSLTLHCFATRDSTNFSVSRRISLPAVPRR